jgi:hypothetical protein
MKIMWEGEAKLVIQHDERNYIMSTDRQTDRQIEPLSFDKIKKLETEKQKRHR